MTTQTVEESLAKIEAMIARILDAMARLQAQKINLLVAARAARHWVQDEAVHKRIERAIEDAEKGAP